MNSINHYIKTKIKGIQQLNDDKVLVQIHLKNGKLWTKEYNQNDNFESIKNDFKLENNENIPEEYISDWKIKNESLKMTDKINTLLYKEIPNLFLNNIKNNIPLSLGQEIIPDIIGKPFSKPFEVFEFYRKEKILKIQKYDNETMQKYQLKEYGPSSAYCNGNNNLFISGGEGKNFEILQNFWKINLKTKEIELFSMMPKKDHSMILIFGGYVFVVGGNDLKAFYFNIGSCEFLNWGDLNQKRTEPALALIHNNLYCFDNLNYKNSKAELTFEKTDLFSENHKWELINPIININFGNKKFTQKFFGVIKDNEDSVIFVGGNINESEDENKYNCKYDIINNIIEPSPIPFKEYNLKEKAFFPFKEDIDYILPDFNRHHPEVLFYQKKKAKLSLVKYEPYKNILKNNQGNHYDNKLNFNMPTFKNENIKVTEEPQIEIREPSFPIFNLTNKNKFMQNPPFKPPEIDPNKPDMSVSIPNLDDIKNVNNKEIFEITTNKIEVKLDEDAKKEYIGIYPNVNHNSQYNDIPAEKEGQNNNEKLESNLFFKKEKEDNEKKEELNVDLKQEIKNETQKLNEVINKKKDTNIQNDINQDGNNENGLNTINSIIPIVIENENNKIKENLINNKNSIKNTLDYNSNGVIIGKSEYKKMSEIDIKCPKSNIQIDKYNINGDKNISVPKIEDLKKDTSLKDISKDIFLKGTIKGIKFEENKLNHNPIIETNNHFDFHYLDLTKDINIRGVILGKRKHKDTKITPSKTKTDNIIQTNLNNKPIQNYNIGNHQGKPNLPNNNYLNNQEIEKINELNQKTSNTIQINNKKDYYLKGVIKGIKNNNNVRHNSYKKGNTTGKYFKGSYPNYPSRNNNYKGQMINNNYYKNYTHNPKLNSPKYNYNKGNMNMKIKEQNNNNINENIQINKTGKAEFTLQDLKFSPSNIPNIYTNENHILDNSRNKLTLPGNLYESINEKEEKINNINLEIPKLELNNVNNIKNENENEGVKKNIKMNINSESNNNIKLINNSEDGNNSNNINGNLYMTNHQRNDFETNKIVQDGKFDIDKNNSNNMQLVGINGQK